MKLTPLFFVLFTLSVAIGAYSQPWLYPQPGVLKSAEDSLTVFDKFEDYWRGKPYEKGKGYKQFQRWMCFMKPRLYPDMEQLDNSVYQRYYGMYRTAKYRSANYPEWKLVGPVSRPQKDREVTGMGRMNCIYFHPTNSDLMYAGAPSGGLWKYSRQSKLWELVNDQLPCIGISDIVVNSQNPDEIYILTGDGDAGDTYSVGILKSVNGGKSFQQTVFSAEQKQEVVARRIVSLSDDAQKQVATTSMGIYRTTDGWGTGVKILQGHFKDLEISPNNLNVLYVAKYSDSDVDAGVYRSVDGGETFDRLPFAIGEVSAISRIELAVTKAEPTVVYAVCANKSDGGFYALYRSDNSGDNWRKVEQANPMNIFGWTLDGADRGGQAWYDLAIAVDPSNANAVYVGAVNIWKSTDGGSRWQFSSDWLFSDPNKYVHADVHDLAFAPNGDLYACHDGGVSVSSTKGDSWTDISDGLAVTQLYHLDFDGNRFIFGSQDNGTNYFTNGRWKWLLSGDGMYCAFDYANPDILYGSYFNGEIYKSENGGFSFENITPSKEFNSTGAQGAWVTPYMVDVEDPKILYAGYSNVYKSSDRGGTWSQISDVIDASNKITVLKQATCNPSFILAASIKDMWLTTNGGAVWTKIDDNLPDLAIADADFAFSDPYEIWVSFSGYSANNRVYYTETGGASWSNYSKGLPELPINAIIAQPRSNKALYAGTDLGVYYRNALMDSWEKYSDQLPATVVNQLLITDNVLYAATYGRGIWQTGLFADSTANWYADFSAESQIVCADSSVRITFANESSVEFDSLLWDFGEYAIPQTATGSGPHMVSFPYEGQYTVSATGYKYRKQYNERKFKYITAVTELPVEFKEQQVISCGNQVELFVGNWNSVIWEDTLHGLSFSGPSITYTPEFSSVFQVSVMQGSCSGTGDMSVSYIADDICSAEQLGLGLYGPFSNSCGTAQYNEPVPDTLSADACNSQYSWCSEGGVQHSVWFQINPGHAEHLYINAPGFDNQIALYNAKTCNDVVSGDESNFVLLAANDDYNAKDHSSTIEYAGLGSQDGSFWLQVDGSGGGEKGQFYLDIREEPPLTARFEADTTFIFPNESIHFTNTSFGTASRWEWTFQGGKPSFSYLQHPPAILYESRGVYDVRLIVYGDEGVDTLLKNEYINVGNTRQICDTVTNFIGTPSLYTLDIGGYLSGNNSFGDQAKAERFDLTHKYISGFEIDWVDITFGYASKSDIEINVVVWDDKSGRPGTAIAKQSIPLSNIAEDVFWGQATRIYFDTPIEVGAVFFIGAELPSIGGDALAIKTNMEQEAVGNTAWDLWSNGQWGAFRDNYNLMVAAHVCELPSSVGDFIIMPNPVKDVFYIDMGNFEGHVLSIDVFSIVGDRKAHYDIDASYPNFLVDCSRLASGIYIVRIETDQGIASKKIVKNTY